MSGESAAHAAARADRAGERLKAEKGARLRAEHERDELRATVAVLLDAAEPDVRRRAIASMRELRRPRRRGWDREDVVLVVYYVALVAFMLAAVYAVTVR